MSPCSGTHSQCTQSCYFQLSNSNIHSTYWATSWVVLPWHTSPSILPLNTRFTNSYFPILITCLNHLKTPSFIYSTMPHPSPITVAPIPNFSFSLSILSPSHPESPHTPLTELISGLYLYSWLLYCILCLCLMNTEYCLLSTFMSAKVLTKSNAFSYAMKAMHSDVYDACAIGTTST